MAAEYDTKIIKKIEFGYSNSKRPTGSFEGIGIKEGLFITEGEYLGSFNINGLNFIAARVINKNNEYSGKIIVREALVDLFSDGSTILYLNSEQESGEKAMETLLNIKLARNELNDGEIVNSLNDDTPIAYRTNKAFQITEMDPEILATSILPEVFKAKKEAIRECRERPFSELVPKSEEINLFQNSSL